MDTGIITWKLPWCYLYALDSRVSGMNKNHAAEFIMLKNKPVLQNIDISTLLDRHKEDLVI